MSCFVKTRKASQFAGKYFAYCTRTSLVPPQEHPDAYTDDKPSISNMITKCRTCPVSHNNPSRRASLPVYGSSVPMPCLYTQGSAIILLMQATCYLYIGGETMGSIGVLTTQKLKYHAIKGGSFCPRCSPRSCFLRNMVRVSPRI